MVEQAFEHGGSACFRLLYLWERAKVAQSLCVISPQIQTQIKLNRQRT